MIDAAKLSQATQDILAHIVALDIAAAKAGQDHPTSYPAFTLSAAEQSALSAQLASQGLHVPPGGLAGADANTQCGVAAATQHFLASLTPDRIAAFESLEAQEERKALGGG